MSGRTLHAVWSPGRGTCLWSEDPDRPVTSASRARGARPHPFAAPAETVAADTGLDGVPGEATLWLPSDPDGPRDSPTLARDGADPATARLLRWTVPVLEIAPGALAAGPWAGESATVPVLRALDAFAADLVDRGRVVPVLPAAPADGHRRSGDAPGAVGWRPVLQGPDLVAADSFAAALPPAARAEHDPDGGGELDPGAVVTEALEVAVDALARRRARALDDPLARAALSALADPAHRRELGTGLARWEVVAAPHAGPARATFRLAEVVVDDLGHAVDGEPRWWLEFSLQATQDPSLRVTAASVWRDPGALRRWLEDPEELLLAELGRAARLYPELGDALRVPRPSGMDLDLAGTHHFLAEVAGELDRAGFGVLLPAWWSKPVRLGLAPHAAPYGSSSATPGPEGVVATRSRVGRDDLVDFAWRLSIDGEALSDAEMDALVEAKAPLVQLRGQWVALDRRQVEAGLDFLRRHPDGTATVGEALRLAVSHADDLGAPLPLEELEAPGVLGDLLDGAAERTLTLLEDVPTTATLRPYQRRGVSWLAFLASLGVGAVLADDMGLGKTLQVLALEAHERFAHALVSDRAGPGPPNHSRGASQTLLVCPTSVVTTWAREAARFVPDLAVATYHGPNRTLPEEVDLVVTSYGTLLRDVDTLSERRFHRLVLDEAQTVKNSRSRAARAVRRIDAAHRVALTGTPVENRLAELWAILDAVNPGVLGTVTEFRDRYAVPIERHGRSDVAARLRVVTRPFLLRRVKTDPAVVDDLPDKIETVERCPLSAEQASLYQVVVDEMLSSVSDLPDGVERRGRVLAAMTKLKQVCDHPAVLLHDGSPVGRRSGKIARLEEIVAEILAAGEKALLFTQYTEFGDLLAGHLAARFDTEVAWLHGGTSRKARDAMVERFQSGEGPSLFLLSLKAGGTGLTLTAAQHVVHLDRWWNPAVEDQATDRAFRIGQKRTVTVRKLVCGGTLEERIGEMIDDKRALADTVVGTSAEDPDWLGGLSTDELRRVVALGSEAVPENDEGADDEGADDEGADDEGADGSAGEVDRAS